MPDPTVRFQPEHLRAVERGIRSLAADRDELEQWNLSSVDLNQTIDDLKELAGWMRFAQMAAAA